MAARSRARDQYDAAMRVLAETEATQAEKAEMLMEIAMGLQQRPQAPDDIDAAIELYDAALAACPADGRLLAARIKARLATALMAAPAEGSDGSVTLRRARAEMETAIEGLGAGGDEEIAEAHMNLGLILQSLVPYGAARLQDAIKAYQRALRTFSKEKHPKDYAILQNNLAIAYLSVAGVDESGKLREALAVQAFEEGLAVVDLISHPNEYAMLQNNLGNALQYAASSHRVENGFRALEAYDEALKVRTRRTTPQEYANTIANKANCLVNLPDDPEQPEAGNAGNLAAALSLFVEAKALFDAAGETGKSHDLAVMIAEIEAAPKWANGAH